MMLQQARLAGIDRHCHTFLHLQQCHLATTKLLFNGSICSQKGANKQPPHSYHPLKLLPPHPLPPVKSKAKQKNNFFNNRLCGIGDVNKRQVAHLSSQTQPPQHLQTVLGVALCAGLMHVGFTFADVIGQQILTLQGIEGGKSPLSGIPIAILVGMAVRNTPVVSNILTSNNMTKGINFCKDTVLKAGIVCAGAKLSAFDILTVGAAGVPAALISVTLGLTVIPKIGRALGLPEKMSTLIASGTSICGVTAITAISPIIKATQRDTSFAVANVVAFGTLSMLITPYIAHALLPTSEQIGVFLGLSVHDTSQVIGSALSYKEMYNDEVAFQSAIITKLSRNLTLIGVIPMLTYMHIKSEQLQQLEKEGKMDNHTISPMQSDLKSSTLQQSPTFKLGDVKKYVPSFVVGFAGMSVFRTFGDMSVNHMGSAYGVMDPSTWGETISFIGDSLGSHYLLGTAMAAVGLSTSLGALKGVGWRPFAVGLSGSLLVSGTGMSLALLLPSMGLV
eukprot:m.30088 g.30088  ORF g.30088 m.30088 type:complete len:505 (-) comp9611_c0_seq1:45-1559(-)